MSELEHFIRVTPSYDHRDEPDDRRGAHGVELILVTRGPLGAVSGHIGTGWMLRPLAGDRVTPGGPQRQRNNPGVDGTSTDYDPRGLLIRSHSTEQRHDSWNYSERRCEWLDTDGCWGTAGYTITDSLVEALVSGGDEGAFARLDEIYTQWLGGHSAE